MSPPQIGKLCPVCYLPWTGPSPNIGKDSRIFVVTSAALHHADNVQRVMQLLKINYYMRNIISDTPTFITPNTAASPIQVSSPIGCQAEMQPSGWSSLTCLIKNSANTHSNHHKWSRYQSFYLLQLPSIMTSDKSHCCMQHAAVLQCCMHSILWHEPS